MSRIGHTAVEAVLFWFVGHSITTSGGCFAVGLTGGRRQRILPPIRSVRQPLKPYANTGARRRQASAQGDVFRGPKRTDRPLARAEPRAADRARNRFTGSAADHGVTMA